MTADTTEPGERGATLLLALVVLVIASAAVLMAFTAAFFEWRAGGATGRVQQALATADAGLASVEGGWSPFFDSLPRGQPVQLPSLVLGPSDSAGLTLLPLTRSLYRVSSQGWRITPQGGASAVLAAFLRLDPPMPQAAAAISAVDTALMAAGTFRGDDSIPPGWAVRCPPPASAMPGLRVGTGTSWSGSCPGCSGSPAALIDSTLSAALLTRFGPDDYASLALRAAHTLAGTIPGPQPAVGGSPAACLTADSLNWGEPLAGGPGSACRGFYPIIHVPGDLRLVGGRGQGILLVDGDLDLAGGAMFAGIVVVRGRLTASGSGGTVLGSVLASRVVLAGAGSLLVQFSSCALGRVLEAAGRPMRLGGWSWTQVY